MKRLKQQFISPVSSKYLALKKVIRLEALISPRIMQRSLETKTYFPRILKKLSFQNASPPLSRNGTAEMGKDKFL